MIQISQNKKNGLMSLLVQDIKLILQKIGFVLFGGTGTVASSPDKFRVDEFQFSYGAGLRYLFNKEQKVNVRVDFGISRNGSTGIYFGIEAAF